MLNALAGQVKNIKNVVGKERKTMKIHSIIPASGWYACFSVENEKLIVDPVAVWGIVTEDIDGEKIESVKGFVSDEFGLGQPEYVKNFTCYLSEEEVKTARAVGDIVDRMIAPKRGG